jgi:hypothetical protein
MELLEFDFRVYGPDFKPFSLPTGVMEPPWLPRWMSFCNMAVRQRGGSPDAANMLYSWTLQHGDFDDVTYQDYFIPTAPFMSPEDPNYDFIRGISETFREDIQVSERKRSSLQRIPFFSPFSQTFLRSGRPLLLMSGLPEPLVDELQHHTHLELKEARTVSYIRVERVYARKKP